MKEYSVYDKINIISYKHNGKLHRVWYNVDKIYASKDLAILLNNEVDVIDGDGRKWKSREPAICYFYKKYWFNIICMIRGDDICYYCNLSSPYVIDREGLKYIDYDLDVKVYPTGEIIELDRDEYNFNIHMYRYSEDIQKIIAKNLRILKEMIQSKKEPFDAKSVKKWYHTFLRQDKGEC